MNVLVIGKGGREHALVWKFSQSPKVTKVFCAPGNAGTGVDGVNVPIEINDVDAQIKFAKKEHIGLTIVGPEDPLAAGVVDDFQKAGLRIFGPSKTAAQLESSKVFAKVDRKCRRQRNRADVQGIVRPHLDLAREAVHDLGAVTVIDDLEDL